MSDAIPKQIQEDMKSAMRSHDKPRLNVIRLIMAAFKQVNVDERIEIDDERAILILAKMLKQRHESITQFQAAKRQDLVDQEQFEVGIIQTYLPAPLDETEIKQHIAAAIATANAQSIQDMGKVMTILKPQLQGRADLAAVSSLIKQQLG